MDLTMIIILKELAEKLEGQFTCLGENLKIHNLFSSNRKGCIRIDKEGKQITKAISYKLQFIDSARFMESSLSNLVSKPIEEIHKMKCKYRHNDRKTCGIKHKNCECFLKHANFKDALME